MINIGNATLSFGGRVLFENITLFVDKQDKIGLVGRNGAGKSTLFKMILGEQLPDEGQVTLQPDLTVGHLQQELGTMGDNSVFEEAKTAFTEIDELEQRLVEINHALTTRTDYESEGYLKLCEELAESEERFAMLGGDQREKNIANVLGGLGFSQTDFHKPMSSFSGGWQMRVELAKILLRKPNILLLDEPTNHLDIVSIQWLEKFLKVYPGAVILISHDRQFLDNVTNRTIEIANRKIYDYNVPYTAYKEQRAERMATLQAAYENQQKQIADTEKFIDRFRAKATKARQVQSKIKQLDKLDRIELDQDEDVHMQFRFPKAPRAGAVLFDAENLAKAYGPKTVFNKVQFEIERGDRIAFVGKNGMGKSTLSKILMGLTDYSGKLKEGHNLQKGYFAQDNIAGLPPKKSAFDVIDDLATGDMRTQVRNLLGAFLFRGEEADKKVSVMSGGEKSRLSLAKLLLEHYNFLVLDEPTNHLDMQSKDILKEALLHFNGTYVVVSHDREFLRGLATKVFAFEDGKVQMHIGGIDEYLRRKNAESVEQSLADTTHATREEKATNKAKPDYAAEKEDKRQAQQKAKALSNIEKNIAELETKLAELEQKMAELAENGETTGEQWEAIQRAHQETQSSISESYHEWESLESAQ